MVTAVDIRDFRGFPVKCEINPYYYKRCVDDIFMLFSSNDMVKRFLDFVNSRHPSINFTVEHESDGMISFLDVKISRNENVFVTDVYRKKTFSGVFTNYSSFVAESFKRGLLMSLLHRGFHICSSWDKFHEEINNLRSIFVKNGYPNNMINKCIKLFFEKLHTTRVTVLTAPKKEVILVVLFLGVKSLLLHTNLTKFFNEFLPCCKLKVIFSSNCRLRSFFSFKDKIPLLMRSGVVYRFTCASCNACYYGKTKRHFKVRIAEHIGISHLTGKPRKSRMSTAVSDHLLECSCPP